MWDYHYHPNRLLQSNKRKRPRIEFETAHDESETHIQCIRTLKDRRIPVPIGPAIPRRDHEVNVQKHARLMLILFKPWMDAASLRVPGQMWSEAYLEFLNDTDARTRRLIDNMQVLHECKDARD
ncbi:hypothetical protein C8J56DRAFT_786200, partial [Mycena floridula]